MPFAAAVLRAGIFDDRKCQRLCEVCDAPLAGIEHRPDLIHARARHVCHRLKAADAPLVHEREQKRLDRVIKMVTERELRDAALAERRAQCTAAHLGAQGAGVILLAYVEHDLLDVGLQARIRHAERRAQLRDRLERKRLRIIPPQFVERKQKHERILASRDTDGDGVARRDHVIILHTPAHQAGESIQVIHGRPPKMKIENAKSRVKRRKTEIFKAKQYLNENSVDRLRRSWYKSKARMRDLFYVRA